MPKQRHPPWRHDPITTASGKTGAVHPTGRAVCGYLLVRGSVHAHAYALALKQITDADITKVLPTPNIPLSKIPECQSALDRDPGSACKRDPLLMRGVAAVGRVRRGS